MPMTSSPKYLNEFRDRHGRVRRYFRRPGQRAIALPGEPNSPEFMAAYLDALGKVKPAKPRASASTFSAVISEYYTSAAFLALAENTRKNRRSFLERIRSRLGDDPVTAMTQEHVAKILSKLTPAVAHGYWQALHALMAYAVSTGRRKDDPTAGVKRVAVKSEKIHPWVDAEHAQYNASHPLGTMPHLAWALGFYTAQRLGDLITMGPQHVVDGMIHIAKQQKTKAEVWIEIHPELAKATAAMKVTGTKTWLVNERGAPFTDGSFGNAFRRWCNAAGLPQCSMHGLRHAGLTWYAECGATAPEIQARGGHKTLAQAQHYIELANKKKLGRSGGAKVADRRAGE